MNKIISRGSRELLGIVGDFQTIFLSKEAVVLYVLALLSSIGAMALSKYQLDTEDTLAWPGYVIWIGLTRLGDCFLVYYPWKLCRPQFLTSPNHKRVAILLALSVVGGEFVFALGPSKKNEWEEESKTSSFFKLAVVLHYIWYFGILFAVPYWLTSSSQKNSVIILPVKQSSNETIPMSQGLQRDVDATGSSKTIFFIGVGIVIFSFLAISIIYVSDTTIFELGPLVFIPLVIVLAMDSKTTITHHRGYCLTITIFQLGIHALPAFIIRTLFKGNTGGSRNVISALVYYGLMAGYGHQWRLVSFNATSPYSHVALLMLFQIFDVIFSNMAFVGVRQFNVVYFLLILMTMTRIFIRESKIPNDVITYIKEKKKQKKGHIGNKVSSSVTFDASLGNASLQELEELAILQCTRIRRARQNIMLEIASSFLLPFIFVMDSMTRWSIMVREEMRFNNIEFLVESSFIILFTRLLASSFAWIYLKQKASEILTEIDQRQQTALPKDCKAVLIDTDINLEATEIMTLPVSPTQSTNSLAFEKAEAAMIGSDGPHLQFVKLAASPNETPRISKLRTEYQMLYSKDFRTELQGYFKEHMLYFCVCFVYGILNAVIFTGNINREMRLSAVS